MMLMKHERKTDCTSLWAQSSQSTNVNQLIHRSHPLWLGLCSKVLQCLLSNAHACTTHTVSVATSYLSQSNHLGEKEKKVMRWNESLIKGRISKAAKFYKSTDSITTFVQEYQGSYVYHIFFSWINFAFLFLFCFVKTLINLKKKSNFPLPHCTHTNSTQLVQ